MAGSVRRSFGMSVAVLGALLFAGSALLVSASAAGAASTMPSVMVAQNTKLGSILTDSQGMTLYVFKKDKPGESVCVDTCAKNWPPLTVPEGMQPMAGSGIPGKLGQIERKDDTYQVTYDGMPLYRFGRDSKPGDMNGQGMGSVWYVVPTTTSSAASTSGAAAKGW
jgi:predicted lipoprotein with Yx(FWY)xxD motif